MSKYVRGVKRNQIIQRWLQGIEDPVYDVFPTKKEGKYIVKLRESPIESTSDEQPVIENQDNDIPTNEPPINEPSDMDSEPPRKPLKSSSMIKPQSIKRSVISRQQQPDSTINLEILEQLRSLGEEIRNDRFKKEQKQYIKQVVNKELSKSRIRSRYIPDTLIDNDVKPEPVDTTPTIIDTPEPVPEPEPTQQSSFRSRIRR